MNREKNLVIRDLIEMNESLISYVEELFEMDLMNNELGKFLNERFLANVNAWDSHSFIDGPKWIMKRYLDRQMEKEESNNE